MCHTFNNLSVIFLKICYYYRNLFSYYQESFYVIPVKTGIYLFFLSYTSYTSGFPLQFTLTKVGVGMTGKYLIFRDT